MDTATSAQASLTELYGQSPFPNELRAASSSPVLMKQLKKEYGDSFLSKIIQLTTEQEPHVKEMEEALGNFAVTREALHTDHIPLKMCVCVCVCLSHPHPHPILIHIRILILKIFKPDRSSIVSGRFLIYSNNQGFEASYARALSQRAYQGVS